MFAYLGSERLIYSFEVGVQGFPQKMSYQGPRQTWNSNSASKPTLNPKPQKPKTQIEKCTENLMPEQLFFLKGCGACFHLLSVPLPFVQEALRLGSIGMRVIS